MECERCGCHFAVTEDETKNVTALACPRCKADIEIEDEI
jgi:hypothetical protein